MVGFRRLVNAQVLRVTVEAKHIERIRELSAELRISMSEVVRRVLDGELKL